MSFSDALALLGCDPPAVAALDRALGGALSVATGGVADGLLRIADARGSVLTLGRGAVLGVGRRLAHAESRAQRTELLHAAHTVIVVVAWFQALDERHLPVGLDALELTRREQLALAGASSVAERGDAFARSLAATDAPSPAPHRPVEAVMAELERWYEGLSARFLDFAEGLLAWNAQGDAARNEARRLIRTELPREAVEQYASLYAQLAQEAPEFGLWTTQIEHQATRAEVRRSLAGVTELLAGVARTVRPPVDVAASLVRSAEAVLTRSVLDASSGPEGIRVPTLREMYLDPDFRVREVAGPSGPANESWWEEIPVRRDITGYLAGALTSAESAVAPLLVLGQPGAGKSVLTRVLAARLPSAGFLPVRVPLRDVHAEDDVQTQIEQAVRAATGERTSWPELVRSAGGAVPVLLLDGFDELLQTTGIHHSDFLDRVARFQQREADQGRPIRALVTSRIAVADRARYPEGLVALRLEPFRPDQIRHWLALWNEANADGFAARGVRPLDWEAVARHRSLAAQPLLLTMLAMYDASDNALRRDSESPLDEAELYEELLTSFARREIDKTGPAPAAVPDDEARARAERELQRLSLVAFALHNRRRQWVSAAELDEDLTALLGRASAEASGFRTPLGAAEVALGRFFFVQRAQSVRDGRVLATYEFLHATFGEYLVVRLTLHVLTSLLTHRPSLSMAESSVDDDLAYTLLSYAPLSSRQMLRFAASLVRRIPAAERDRLASLLIAVLQQHGQRGHEPHRAYRPMRSPASPGLRTSARHGIYGANLVLVILLLKGRVTAGELFPSWGDHAGAWHRHVLLWRSAFDEEQWTDFALSLSLRRTWNEGGRELEIALRDGALDAPEPMDMNWLFRFPRGNDGPGWSRTYWDELRHKADVSGSTNDGVVRHAMDPVFAWLGPAVTTFTTSPGGPATSLAHDVLELLLGAGDLPPDEEDAVRARVLGGLADVPLEVRERIRRLLAPRRDRRDVP
ncbi:NACHT domain-containing protein [Streptomyces sp. enrichment culture]|uniref:NACHT domain-containing protein n=1 Tax=Streptomyces sp. enrichment culture TaxID=1795815 RepID=UPI003F57AC06